MAASLPPPGDSTAAAKRYGEGLAANPLSVLSFSEPREWKALRRTSLIVRACTAPIIRQAPATSVISWQTNPRAGSKRLGSRSESIMLQRDGLGECDWGPSYAC